MIDGVYTTGQIARICKVSPRTVKNWIDSGKLKGYKLPSSGDRRVTRESLVHFMKAHEFPLERLSPEAPAPATTATAPPEGAATT